MKKNNEYLITNCGHIKSSNGYKSLYSENDTPLLNPIIENTDKKTASFIYSVEMKTFRTLLDIIADYSINNPVLIFTNTAIYCFIENKINRIIIRLVNSWGSYDFLKIYKGHKKNIILSFSLTSMLSLFSYFLYHRNGEYKDIKLFVNENKLKIVTDEENVVINSQEINISNITDYGISENLFCLLSIDELVLPNYFKIFDKYIKPNSLIDIDENFLHILNPSYEIFIFNIKKY